MSKKNIFEGPFQQATPKRYDIPSISFDYLSGVGLSPKIQTLLKEIGPNDRGIAPIKLEDLSLPYYSNDDLPNYFPRHQKKGFQVDKEYLDKKQKLFDFLKNLANGRRIFILDLVTMKFSEIKTYDDVLPPLGTSDHYFFVEDLGHLMEIFMKIPRDGCTPSMRFENLKTNKYSFFQFGDPLGYIGIAKKDFFSLFNFVYIKVLNHNVHHLVTVDFTGRLINLKQHIN